MRARGCGLQTCARAAPGGAIGGGLVRVARNGLGRGTLPRSLRRQLDGAAGEERPACLMGIAGRQGDLDPGLHLDDPGGDLDQREADRVELSGAPERGLGGQATQRVQEPVGRGVDQQTELVRGGAGARRPVRGEVQLVRLDQVLGLAALAVDALVKPARRAFEVGDDEAAVAALGEASMRAMTRRRADQLLAA